MPESSWVWLRPDLVRLLHARQLAEHGGMRGMRDVGLLESALMRPQQAAHYGTPSLFELAASYAYGIARNHPFLDGNKRTAFLTAYVFLKRNGWQLRAGEAESTHMFVALAAGEISESVLAEWFKTNSAEAQTH